jgi:hypothetical protein
VTMYSKLLDYGGNAFERHVEYQKHEFELFIIEIVEKKHIVCMTHWR